MASGRPKTATHSGSCLALNLRRAEESVLGKVLVETIILYMATRHSPSQVLHDAAAIYKVDTEAIALKVKQEFAAKRRHRPRRGPLRKPKPKP